MDTKSIGQFIAILRKSKGMTQQEVAHRLNITNKTVSKWECGEGYPEIEMIPALAELFDVTTDEILKGSRIQKEEPDNEKTPVKVEKQIKRLLSSTITRFKNYSFISLTLIFLGLVSLFTISYAFLKPIIGFGIMLVFIAVGAILELIILNNTNSALKSSELISEEDAMLAPYFRTMYKYVFAVFSFSLTVIIVALPFILTRDSNFIDSVINIGIYLKLFPTFLLISIVVCFICNHFAKQMLKSNPAFKYVDIPEEKRKEVRSLKKKISIVFLLVLFATFAGQTVIDYIAIKPQGVKYADKEEFNDFINNYEQYNEHKKYAIENGYTIYDSNGAYQVVQDKKIEHTDNEYNVFNIEKTYENIVDIDNQEMRVFYGIDYANAYSARKANNLFFTWLYLLEILIIGIVYMFKKKKIHYLL